MRKSFVLIFLCLFLVLPTSKVLAGSDYKLAFPGIMPGNVLWPVKDLRDTVISLFIFDPVAKSYYYLLQADKRMAMVELLTDDNLKNQALTAAQNYFDRALLKEDESYLKGQDTGKLFAKINSAAVRYQEISSDSARLNRVKEIFLNRLIKNIE